MAPRPRHSHLKQILAVLSAILIAAEPIFASSDLRSTTEVPVKTLVVNPKILRLNVRQFLASTAQSSNSIPLLDSHFETADKLPDGSLELLFANLIVDRRHMIKPPVIKDGNSASSARMRNHQILPPIRTGLSNVTDSVRREVQANGNGAVELRAAFDAADANHGRTPAATDGDQAAGDRSVNAEVSGISHLNLVANILLRAMHAQVMTTSDGNDSRSDPLAFLSKNNAKKALYLLAKASPLARRIGGGDSSIVYAERLISKSNAREILRT